MNNNDMCATFVEQYKSFMGPANQIQKQIIADLEKLVTFQMKSLSSYVDLSMAELKAASEMTSFKDFNDFYKRQMELSGVFHKKFADDATTLFEMTTNLGNDYAKLSEKYMDSSVVKTQFMPKAA